jgi:aminoglycoside phosphotransferase (APT) family kinase protein
LEGLDATVQQPADLDRTATALGTFVAALQRVDPSGAPHPGEHNFGRGLPLAARHEATIKAIETLAPDLDFDAATAAWRSALRVPPWDGPPVWLHGDLSPLNLLVERGEVTGVIDFGGMAVGDPACDLLCAWAVLSNEARAVLRGVLEVDDATWERGRGWALSVGLILIPYYTDSNPILADVGRQMVDEVLADHGEEGARRAWK